MISGALIEGSIALLVAVFGGIFLFGKMHSANEKNAEEISEIKRLIKEGQDAMKQMMIKNMADMRVLIDENKIAQNEALSREVSHLKDIYNISCNETRADIQRLEMAQKSSNRVRERLAIAESSLRSLHHRLDIDPPKFPEAIEE